MVSKASLSVLIFLATFSEYVCSFSPCHSHLLISSKYLPLNSHRRYTRPQMSMSENYLNDITNNNKLPLTINNDDFHNMFRTAQPTNETEIKVNTIYVNINKLNSLYFKRDSKMIMFMLQRELDDIYYCNNSKLYKVSDKTKIIPTTLKKFIITELHTNIDALIV
jgi:hypothetical protein